MHTGGVGAKAGKSYTGTGALSGHYSGMSGRHRVSKNIDGGKFIKLEDGSLWEISPIFISFIRFWLVTQEIIVIENDNPLYPYKLINSDSNDWAEAKFISQ